MTYIESYKESVKLFEENIQSHDCQGCALTGGRCSCGDEQRAMWELIPLLLSSAIAFHQGEVEKLEGMITYKEDLQEAFDRDEINSNELLEKIGANSALTSLLTDHKAFLEWAEKQ